MQAPRHPNFMTGEVPGFRFEDARVFRVEGFASFGCFKGF